LLYPAVPETRVEGDGIIGPTSAYDVERSFIAVVEQPDSAFRQRVQF